MKPPLTLVTHVDWGHIRQRPHHLAVALGETYRVTVVSPLARARAQLLDNPAPGLRRARVWRLPGSYRSAVIARANARLAGLQCAGHVRSAEVVVVTSPELWPWVAGSLSGRTLVYDCMDDALAFEQDRGVRAMKAQWERALLARSDRIVCSSDELAARVIARGAQRERVVVVPNGWDREAFPVAEATALPRDGPIELVYFGTIATWIDVDALRAAARCPGATIRLIGPGRPGGVLDVPGVRIEPPVEHHRLAHAASSADALLLPFVVDELTRAVDPVKLYEYIALGKPILASHWAALDRFADFVTFYRDGDQLARLVRSREVDAPPSAARREAFLAPQSWQARGEAFRQAIADARR